ncbi:hypothetical protein JQC72_06660 [Polycladomyces sp. WAk]|uniref:Uncharacterized protein n=1 Tax=Polycladomyces zharkentensis TaxID=2807616 RepID=A0ABS2WIA0_9BACL|nr:hypothetical protein [Polycladomyces sp. WAk]MBN2909203.1 hypothetical protein [Polycladomyces sp. WAk]
MKLEMLRNINLHDSLMESIHFIEDKKELRINLELCNWKQKNYKEGEAELVSKILIFKDVEEYNIEPDFPINSDEILEVKITEPSKVEIIILGESDIKKMNIRAKYFLWSD